MLFIGWILCPAFALMLSMLIELAMVGIDSCLDAKLLRYLCPVITLSLSAYSVAAAFLKSLPYPNGKTLPLNDPISAGVLEGFFVNPVFGSAVSFFALAGCIIVLQMMRSVSRQ